MFDGSQELVVPTLNPGKRTNEKEKRQPSCLGYIGGDTTYTTQLCGDFDKP